MISRISIIAKTLQNVTSMQVQQTRNTFIVKRRFPLNLHKIGQKPRQFKQKQYVYDLVKDTKLEKKPNIEVVLTKFVEGVGFKGDIVSARPNFARYSLLLPKLAVYASPENIQKYATNKDNLKDEKKSLSALMTSKFLSKSIVSVLMNMDNPWTIEKCHVRASLRKAGIQVPDHAIELPTTSISGPTPDIHGKMFLTTITINGDEKVIVRCRIFLWTPEVTRRLPMIRAFNGEHAPPLFPEDEEIIKNLPEPNLLKVKSTGEQPNQ